MKASKKKIEMSIAGLLKSKGINPDKADGSNIFYGSPNINKKTPRFKVFRSKDHFANQKEKK